MKAVTEFTIAMIDFAQAEARRLVRSIHRHALVLVLSALLGVLAFLGVIALLGSMLLALATVMAMPLALLFTGVTTLLVSGILLWLIQQSVD